MNHLYKPPQPSPQLHQHPRDKFLLSRIIPTNQPPITNKGKLGITNPRTKATINRREAVNNQILPTISR